MYKSKMIQMLRNLSPKELTRFGEYLASPFFNKDEQLPVFFHYLKKYAPEFESRNLEKERMLEKGIPGLALSEKKLGYLMSDIVEHLEGFIRYNQHMADDLEGYVHLLSKYNDWEADKFFEQTLRDARAYLDAEPYRNAPHFYKAFLLQSELNTFFDRQKKRAYDVSLQEAANYLDLFYLSTKLRYSCELINRQKLVASDYSLRLLKEITDHLREHAYDDYPSISIYFQVLMTFLEGDNEVHFEKLKHQLEEHTEKFPPAEARDMYAYAQNFTIRKINAGDKKYLREYFNISVQALEKGLLMVDGDLSPWTYKNLVVAALRVGEYDWAEQFIKQYRSKLNEKFRANAYNYNMGALLFYKGNLGEALRLINQVEFTDIFYALDTRTMQIKIYYQLDEWDPMQSAIEAFKVYLRRNKTLSENVKLLYVNFLKFIDKLSRLTKRDKTKLEDLRSRIEETRQIADIGWLQAKVEEKLNHR